jgi:myb proto-oncogene protein
MRSQATKDAEPAVYAGSWTAEEDQQLLGLVATSGAGDWAAKAAALPGTRTANAVRARYFRRLRPKDAEPAVYAERWTAEEDQQLLGHQNSRLLAAGHSL